MEENANDKPDMGVSDNSSRRENTQKVVCQINIPQDFLKEFSSFMRASKRNALSASARSFVGLGMSFLFMYLFFFSGGQGQGSGFGGSPYYLMEEKLNYVTVPDEVLKADNVPEIPIMPGTFVIVGINGPIVESDPSFRDKLNWLEIASKEPNIKAVILDINSPGGTVSGSETLREEVLRLKKRGIKVIALYNGVAASGACYMSVDADFIIATRSSLVGSIGVIFSWFNVGGFMNNHGIKMEVFKSGQFKDMGSYARNPSPEEARLFRDLINDTFNRFVEIVMRGRHLTRDEVIKFADGSVFSSTAALDHRLIDRVSDNGKRDAVLKAMELTMVNNPKILRARRASQGFFESLAIKFGGPDRNVESIVTELVTQSPSLRYEWRPRIF